MPFLFSAEFILNNNASLGYRQSNTAYNVGQIAYHSSLPTGWYLKCTIAGTSSNDNLIISSYSVGDTVIDGTITWTIYNEQQNYKIISNQNVSDLNTCTKLGIYRYRDTTLNVPIEAQRYGTVMTLYPRQEDENVCSQIAQGTVSGDIFVRQTLDFQTWSEWRRLVTANEAEIVVAKSFGGNGYITYTSGLIIQWGHAAVNAANMGVEIVFPISFTIYDYVENVLPLTAGGHNNYIIPICIYKLPNEMLVEFSAVPSQSADWFTIGY